MGSHFHPFAHLSACLLTSIVWLASSNLKESFLGGRELGRSDLFSKSLLLPFLNFCGPHSAFIISEGFFAPHLICINSCEWTSATIGHSLKRALKFYFDLKSIQLTYFQRFFSLTVFCENLFFSTKMSRLHSDSHVGIFWGWIIN